MLHLADGEKIICLVRDGKAAIQLAEWLTARGWGTSQLWTLNALGGPRESVMQHETASYVCDPGAALIAVALELKGSNGLPRSAGLADSLFVHDGQITRRPVRALALSALAPRRGERLWDIGAGSGSISVEWALHGGTAFAIEARADRAANIRQNADAFGMSHRITVIEGAAPAILSDMPPPQAVFIGGGLDVAMFENVWALLAEGARLVAHAVTIETEAILADLHQHHGGELMRIEIAHAGQLGRYRAFEPARPVVQWSVVKRSGDGE